mmetsp:Transcript_22240/g.54332  ORF Transcript_22240/g.54332 Transcript_22240/m.54332 type:complete len:248 (+) Transcript_22240:86-829(+)
MSGGGAADAADVAGDGAFDAEKAESMHREARFDEVAKYLAAHYDTDAGKQNPEVLYRLARAQYDAYEALPTSDKKGREAALRRGLELCDEAFKVDADHFGPHKWKAILLAALGDYLSNKEMIANTFIIRDSFLKAIKEAPNGIDATSEYGLGKWYFSCANIGWMQRKVAAALFGELPEAKYEDAVEWYKKAIEHSEQHKRFCLALAECYQAMGKTAERKQWAQKALDAPAASDTEKELVDKEAKKLL